MKKILLDLGIVTLLYFVATQIIPPYIEDQRNPIKSSAPYAVSAKAQELYDDLDFIADLHCDALVWGRDLTEKGEIGHVDFPRMREANVGLEMFTVVSKSPAGQNMESNSADAFDNITPLIITKSKSPSNWLSFIDRTLSQSEELADFVEEENGKVIFIKSRSDLEKLIMARNFDKSVIGAMLGIKGAPALEGTIDNLDLVHAAGVRMIGPTHFFDNELRDSAHGENLGGLTDFRKEVIRKMNTLGIFIDLTHCYTAVVEDVLNMSTTPVIVSHTGVQAVFDSQRNLSDDQIKKIAGKDGVIGIAFFDIAVGEPELPNIIASIRHIRDLVGIQYVALGSDYDGSLAVPFDITGLPLIVEGLMEDGSTTQEIRAVMGENIKEFILKNLR